MTWQGGAQGYADFLADEQAALKLGLHGSNTAGVAGDTHLRSLALISEGSWLRRGLTAWLEALHRDQQACHNHELISVHVMSACDI